MTAEEKLNKAALLLGRVHGALLMVYATKHFSNESMETLIKAMNEGINELFYEKEDGNNG
jgi:hypothetical protein